MNSTKHAGKSGGASSGPAFYSWKVPGAAVQIRISLDAVRRIREYVSDHVEKQVEAGGLLIGKPHPVAVEVHDFAPVARDSESGPRFVLSSGEQGDLRSHIEELNRKNPETPVIGYFRSDLREGICLQEEDQTLIREFFSDPTSVFLVVRPRDDGQLSAGFFFWDEDSVFSTFSFMEFDFDEALLASMQYARPAAPPSAETAGGSGAASRHAMAAAGAERSWRRWGIPAGAAAAVGIGFAAYLFDPRANPPAPTVSQAAAVRARTQEAPTLGLSVRRSGRDIDIAWDAKSPLVNDARVGVITIDDGQLRRDIPLTKPQLLSSRLVYTPRSDTVQVALETFANDGRVTRESVIAVSNSALPAPAAQAVRRTESEAVSEPIAETAEARQTETEQKALRSFIAPSVRTAPTPALATSAPAEPPAVPAPGLDLKRIDAPVGQRPASLIPAPVRAETPQATLSDQRPSPPAISQVSHVAPVPIRQVRPVLPENIKAMLTRRATVKVRIQVDSTGKVTNAEPLAVSGSLEKFLGSAAASAARMWSFRPATDGKDRVPGEITIEFAFLPERPKP